jgi:DNA-binding transcriptional LysR family regulator
MELKHLNTFKYVARTLNFTRAAELLHYAQPTVTAHVQALESELGVALFNRLGREIVLTEAGERLLVYAERLTDLAAEAESSLGQIGEEPVGDVRIGASETLLTYRLPKIMMGFQKQYPTVRLIINPVNFPDLISAVRQGQIDIALAFREAVEADLGYETLLVERMRLLVAPDNPLAKLGAVTAEMLAGEMLLSTSAECPYRAYFGRILDEAGVEMTSNYQFGAIEPIKRFAAHNGGVALLAEIAVRDEVERGELVALPWAGQPLEIPAVMAWHPEKWESGAVQSVKGYFKTAEWG